MENTKIVSVLGWIASTDKIWSSGKSSTAGVVIEDGGSPPAVTVMLPALWWMLMLQLKWPRTDLMDYWKHSLEACRDQNTWINYTLMPKLSNLKTPEKRRGVKDRRERRRSVSFQFFLKIKLWTVTRLLLDPPKLNPVSATGCSTSKDFKRKKVKNSVFITLWQERCYTF